MNPLKGLLEKACRRGLDYNSLDAMKLFAIVNMTADHIGFYFFPHAMWWRAVGRITFPVWFTLVGYSRSRSVGRDLWLYSVLLIVDRPFVDRPIFPLNALVSILLCRYVLNVCEDRKWLPEKLPEVMAAFVFLTIFTWPFFEYGSIAFLYALFGRMVVENEKRHFTALMLTSYLTFITWQLWAFSFTVPQICYVVIGSAWVTALLARKPNQVIWQNWRAAGWKTFITVLSRNTLPYYFYHRLILEIAAALILGKGIAFTLKWQ